MRKAAEHNIPVYRKLIRFRRPVQPERSFPDERSEASCNQNRKTEIERTAQKKGTRFIGITAIFVAVAVVFLFLIVPHAVISIRPMETKREIILPLWTSDTLDAMTLNGGFLRNAFYG